MQHAAAIHKQTIIAQFSQQAVPFAELPGYSQSMQMLIEMSGVSSTDTVLDVACGPGLVACEFAPYAKHVTGIDITPPMIEQAREHQKDKGLTNLTWQVGDVLPLPFPDSQFSMVLTRYTFHHFLNPKAVLSEMVRVCRPGGKVMIADVVQSPEKVDAYDQLEKLRDPSHIHALRFPEMASIIASSGLANVKTALSTRSKRSLNSNRKHRFQIEEMRKKSARCLRLILSLIEWELTFIFRTAKSISPCLF